MAPDDLPLGPAPSPDPRPAAPRTASPTRWVIVGALAVVAGAALALWWLGRAQPGPVTPAAVTATDIAIGSSRPKRQPVDLPPLDASDTLLRDLVSALSRHPLLARLLGTTGLVRAATLAVVQIGDGKTPAVPLQTLRPDRRLQITGTASGRVDPASYARWDAATAALVSVDPGHLAQLYVNLKPLFDEAYQELGHPGGDFDTAVVRAISMLAATPDAAPEPMLLRRAGYFEHEDPALRALRPVQKQFLLLGPANRARVLTWLRQLAATLELQSG